LLRFGRKVGHADAQVRVARKETKSHINRLRCCRISENVVLNLRSNVCAIDVLGITFCISFGGLHPHVVGLRWTCPVTAAPRVLDSLTALRLQLAMVYQRR
jgi:hypothetical protein